MMETIINLETLIAAIEAGRTFKYIFFWGHQPHPNGKVGKPCLSQWWPASFVIDGEKYASAEHYMMAEKARIFEDDPMRQKILAASHPNEAKRLGRKVRNCNSNIWNEYRFDVVVRGNMGKFGQNDELKSFLLRTNKRVLVEASPVDNIWGIGLAADDPKVADPQTWAGQNLLGFALMVVRSQLA